jgi:hypothetical protein
VEGKVRRAYFVDDAEIAFPKFFNKPQKDSFVFLCRHRILRLSKGMGTNVFQAGPARFTTEPAPLS